jgi:hypothetical protein
LALGTGAALATSTAAASATEWHSHDAAPLCTHGWLRETAAAFATLVEEEEAWSNPGRSVDETAPGAACAAASGVGAHLGGLLAPGAAGGSGGGTECGHDGQGARQAAAAGESIDSHAAGTAGARLHGADAGDTAQNED